MAEMMRVLEHTDDPNTYEERTVVERLDCGGLSIRFQHRSHGANEWRTWHDMGADLSPVGAEALRQFLTHSHITDGTEEYTGDES